MAELGFKKKTQGSFSRIGSAKDTGATFWNELEEERELYEGRETDLMGVSWRSFERMLHHGFEQYDIINLSGFALPNIYCKL